MNGTQLLAERVFARASARQRSEIKRLLLELLKAGWRFGCWRNGQQWIVRAQHAEQQREHQVCRRNQRDAWAQLLEACR